MGEWAADCSMRVRSNVVIFISSNVVKQKMSIKYLNPPKKYLKSTKNRVNLKNILFSFTKHTLFRESCRPEELGTGVTCEVTKLRLLIRHRTQNEEFVTLHGQNPSVLPSRAFPQIVD